MIINFKIINYRSYKNETEFSFEALNSEFQNENVASITLEDGEQIRLLKTAAIFGANASGKSNIIWALKALSNLVSNSLKNKVNHTIQEYFPYALDSKSKTQPTEMQIDFIVDKKRYRYGIVFNFIVHRESLSIISQGNERSVFEVIVDEQTKHRKISIGEGWESTSLDMSNAQLLPNQLLLSVLGTRESNGLQNVYSFLATLQAEPVGDAINLKFNSYDVADKILKNSESDLFKKLCNLIRIADMGIEGITMKKHNESEFKFPESIPNEIKQTFIEQYKWEFGMLHTVNESGKRKTVSLPMELESTGTKNLFGVGARVLDILEKGGVLAYDEINIAIHPALFKLIVSLFNDVKSNPHNAQLVFTTHDASIAGDGILRADQIWFAEKKDGISQLYSAQDFDDISINIPFDSWYKSGRFGALPNFGNIDFIFENNGKNTQNDK